MSAWEMFVYGCLGGVIPDILRLVARRDKGAPAYARTWYFWVMLIVLVAIGGLAAWLEKPGNVKEAIAFGFTAPQVLSSLLGKTGDADRGSSGWWKRVRRWWGI
jgi:hypothetical protein